MSLLLVTGFVLGLKHALDADHIAAISTIIHEAGTFRKASLFGAIWGLGHTITLLAAASLVLIFKISIPTGLTTTFEFAVGIMLVLLGMRLFWRNNTPLSGARYHPHTPFLRQPCLI